MSRVTDAQSWTLTQLDRGLLILEDALVWVSGLIGRSSTSVDFTKLDHVQCHIGDIDLPSRDPLEARKAAEYQLNRHAPINPQELEFDTAWIEGEGSWKLVMARKMLLERLLLEKSITEGFVVDVPGGGRAILRLSEHRFRWRKKRLVFLGATIVLVFAALFFANSSSEWLERRATAYAVQEANLLAEATSLREQLNAQDANTPEIVTLALPDVIERLALVQTVKPENWVFRQYEWSGNRLVFVFDENEAGQSSPSSFAGVFRELFDGAEIAITRQQSARNQSQIRVVAVFEEASP